ncbi:dihydroxyacetone kinase subunit L [Nocardia sp. MDA0666]|uniref:dihydroxyacetone kinase subunit DhaL n=1 Tax=Nocardia sp. MDA0666 TaxID=2135448 RepID=UPI000D137DF2|nr:dihydroxyacetone kinase subunit DhaL [Nocardia sp. MDA0666]PSR69706.1 dihydroxyacetone kinase subunit L [Nocardia sp. MDA0666]
MTSEAMTTLDSTVPRLQEVFFAAEPALTKLDEITGDGDFGVNLREGLSEVADRLAAPESPAPWDTLRAVFLDEVGGTSGPLFGLLFQSLGTRAVRSDSYIDALEVGISDGLAAIQRVGEAEVGDRTMVDALAPAVEALHGGDVGAMVSAAVDGALSTAALRARRGRASYLGERAVGHPDPGAVGVALLLCVLAEPVSGTEASDRERARLLDAVSGSTSGDD